MTRTSTPPQPLKAHEQIFTSKANHKTPTGKYAINTDYPFHGASKRARKDVSTDHVLSGAAELMKLLEGQELIVKQNVIARLATLEFAPYVHAVRTIIMQEVQKSL